MRELSDNPLISEAALSDMVDIGGMEKDPSLSEFYRNRSPSQVTEPDA